MNQPFYVAGQTTAAQQGSLPPVPRLQLGAAIDQLGPFRLQRARDQPPAPVQPTASRFGASYTLATSHDLMSGFHSGATSTTYLLKPQDSDNPEAEYADFRLRRAAPVHRLGDLGAARSAPGRRWLKDGALSHVLGGWTARELVDVPERIPLQRLRRRRSVSARGRLHRVVPAEPGRRSGQRRRRRRRSGSTPPPTRGRPRYSSAARRATRSAARAW